MTYRAWEQKPLDRAAVRELTAAIAEQAAAQLEEQAMDEAPWSDEKYKAVLAAQQKENALLAGILAARGITDPAEALTLLAGEEELSDPALLTDMDAACQRIWQAIDDGETIAVFGDYDVDGVTATALLYQHLKGMGATVKCMLPSREGDGYGLSKNAIQSIHDKGCQLIVTICRRRLCPRPWPWWTPAGRTTTAPSRVCAARAWPSSFAPRWTAARRRRCWITAATWPPWARWLT